ncbi:hypothetical protein Tco_0763359 [Tanacetum coccineum]
MQQVGIRAVVDKLDMRRTTFLSPNFGGGEEENDVHRTYRFNKWKESSKNLAKLIDNSLSVKSKLGLGYKDYTGPNEIYYPEMQSIFDPEEANDKTSLLSEHG